MSDLVDSVLGGRRGIVLHRRHLVYGVGNGWFRWTPRWFVDAVVHAWNWVACHTVGHDTHGPYEFQDEPDGENIHLEGYRRGYYPKTCSACSRRWPEGS